MIKYLFNWFEGPVPEWFMVGDVFYLCFATLALGIMFGHMIGKRQ